jgi:Ca2+-binding EF-hand superfamily protein
MADRDAPTGRRAQPLTAGLLAAVLIAGPAQAQSAAELQGYQQRLQQLFQRLDRNGDRRLERREVDGQPYLQRHFERLDQQQRGYLRPEDLSPSGAAPGGGQERARRFLEQADSNGDGRIDRREAEPYPWLQRRFSAVDRDSDGRINRGELQQLRSGERP